MTQRKQPPEKPGRFNVFHLRGNQRTSGETSRKEGGKIFGSGSRAPIAISLLVKNPQASERGRIYFHDIGDYLSREEKLERISGFGSVAGIDGWRLIEADGHGDWLKQRDDSFQRFIVLGDKKGDETKLFDNFSQGVLTARDAWAYNASKAKLNSNMDGMISTYNAELSRFNSAHTGLAAKARHERVDGFINADATRISWSRALKQDIGKGRSYAFDPGSVVPSLYRPFTKQWLYFNRRFNEMVYQMPRIYPDAEAENRVICLTGLGESSGFSALMADRLPNFHFIAGSQCFPLYLYGASGDEGNNEQQKTQTGLFDQAPTATKQLRRNAITDEGLHHFQLAYQDERISKEDVFYYVYGLLHSAGYREQFADNLGKELPRIPRVKAAADFWAFNMAGRALAELHLNYETVPAYAGAKIDSGGKPLADADHRVEKMRFGKSGKDKDRTTIHYNAKITVTGIPLEAYEYVVNGKPAIEWVMERQCVKTDKDSGIVNDANDWAIETMGNPRYPLELLLRVVTVSLETMKIVRSLPALDIREDG
ncbi:type ISP restriction/modification enzyme [Silanimonas sp.]|uniref:type ISP restriction/modification enzyme n=1 Tax=Silanimonas sp. TaxID=1929290 RepID=UPI0037CAC444